MTHVAFLIVDGGGDSSGNLWVWSTSGALNATIKTAIATDLGAAGVTETGGLPTSIALHPATIEPLAALSSDAGWSITVPYTADTSWVTQPVTGAALEVDNEPVRLAATATAAATTLTLSDTAAISPGDYLWLGHEVVLVGTVPTSTTITVTRGRLGTTARPMPLGRPATIVFDGPASVMGRRCRLYVGDASGTTLASYALHRGVVTGVDDDGAGQVTKHDDSDWQRATKQESRPPVRVGTGTGAAGINAWRTGDSTIAVQNWSVDESASAYGSWTYARIRDGDWWAVIAATAGDTGTDWSRGVTLRRYDAFDGRPVAIGYKDEIRPMSQIGLWMGEDLNQLRPVSVEWCHAYASSADRLPSAVLLSLLTGTTGGGTLLPAGVAIGADSTSIDEESFKALDLLIGDELSNTLDSTAAWVWPPNDGPIIDQVTHALRVWGCGLAVTRAGKMRVIDWGSTAASTATIEDADLAEAGYTRQTRQRSGLYAVKISAENRTHTLISEVAHQISGAGREVTVPVGPWAGYWDAIDARWSSLLWGYERTVPVIALRVLDPSAYEIGDTVLLDLDALPAADGAMTQPDRALDSTGKLSGAGPPGVRAKVLAIGEQMQDGTASVTALCVGYGLADVTPAVYGPTATVASGATAGATSVTCEANVWMDAATSSDAESFTGYVTPGARLYVRDQYMTGKGDLGVLTSVAGNVLGIAAGTTTTVVAGDIVTVSKYDQNPSTMHATEIAWMAGTDGELGTVGADPRHYSD